MEDFYKKIEILGIIKFKISIRLKSKKPCPKI